MIYQSFMLDFSFIPCPDLYTERLVLRQMDSRDIEAVLALRADDRVNQYIDRKKMLSIEEAMFFIDRINTGIDNNDWLFWALVEKSTKKFIGTVCFWNIVKEEDKAELGYELIYEAQGKGYMQEAVNSVIDFGFRSMKLKTMEAVIKAGNDKSVKLAEKFAFTCTKQGEEIMIYTLESDIK